MNLHLFNKLLGLSDQKKLIVLSIAYNIVLIEGFRRIICKNSVQAEHNNFKFGV